MQEFETDLWALRDVSFNIKQGEVVGIIGRNGAGKSTLLKILSRITEPASGRIELHGRVGSLLEVGTGFHPELTGRENVYLNGAIMGMRRSEIERKFDEIVAFAEIERFLDTPVKRYSSGMYVRLAFAVAAHLEPEILLVDEVLAVGDAAFQQKCLGKMGDVARGGRTVLFVSHNMMAVRTLCTRGILMGAGSVVMDSTTDSCIQAYTNNSRFIAGEWERTERVRGPLAILKATADLKGTQPDLELEISVDLESFAEHRPAFVAIDIMDTVNGPLMQVLPTLQPFMRSEVRRHKVDLKIELPPLIPGRYTVTLWVGSHNTQTLDQVINCLAFDVVGSPTEGRSFPHTTDHGHIVPKCALSYSSVV